MNTPQKKLQHKTQKNNASIPFYVKNKILNKRKYNTQINANTMIKTAFLFLILLNFTNLSAKNTNAKNIYKKNTNTFKNICMFVSEKRFKSNLKIHFNDKELSKCNSSERAVISFLERFSNTKGNSAYNNFSMMEKKKNCSQNTVNTDYFATQIVTNFLINDDLKNIKKSLDQMFLEWVKSDLDFTQKERQNRVFHYQCFILFLENLEAYKVLKFNQNLKH